MSQYDILATTNVKAIVNELQDIRQTSRKFTWIERIPRTETVDGDIMAKYTGRAYAADIIAYDASAVVRAPAPIKLEQTTIPKYKHGLVINEDMMNVLDRIRAGNASRTDNNIFENYMVNTMTDLIDGTRMRIEAVLVAMLCDSFTYNRLGIQIAGLGWGMPSALKPTVGVLWSVPATATPVNDVGALDVVAQQTYGITYDRMTMSYTAFNYMISTAEFQAKAQLYSGILFPAGSFPINDIKLQTELAQRILNKKIEIDDRQFFVENADGSETATRYQPANKVILTATGFDGDRSAYDFAAGLIQETRPGLVPGIIGGFNGQEFGPVGFWTAATHDGNPPGMVGWAVDRGFPRKVNLAANAVMTVY